MIETNKEDWLSDEINVGGYTSSSKKLTATFNLSGMSTEIRFIKLNDFIQFIITINSTSKKLIRNILESKLFTILKKNLINLIVLGYDDNGFIIYDEEIKTYTKLNLSEYFGSKYVRLIENVGVDKDINKTINDAFQLWTRENLSYYCTINDIDAFYVYNEKLVFLELKRIKDSILDWKPFSVDHANYAALEYFKKTLKIPYFTITYGINASEYVALHTLNKISSEQITGKRMLIDAVSLINFPFGIKY